MITDTALTRLRPLYATAFLQGYGLWFSIDKLFMRSIGFDDRKIALATVVYVATMSITNTPSGILADRWSRKGVLHLATLALIASSLICGVSHSFGTYTFGMALWAVCYSCYGGTYESIVYDMLIEETGSAEHFEQYFGRVNVYNAAAFICSALVSSVVAAHYPLRIEYLATIPVSCLALLTVHRLREPQLHLASPAASLGAHLGDICKAISSSRRLVWVVLAMTTNLAALRFLTEFSQLWLIALVVPAVLFGPAFALLYGGIMAGNWLAYRLSKVLLVAAITLVAGGVLLVHLATAVVLAQGVAITGICAVDIILCRFLHDSLPSRVRAGAASLVLTLAYTAFIPLALAFGWLADRDGIARASLLPLATLLTMVLALVMALSAKEAPHEAS